MLTLLVTILMLVIFGKMFIFGLKMTWGILKFVAVIVFWPLIIVALLLGGLSVVAFFLLVVAGLVSFFACRIV